MRKKITLHGLLLPPLPNGFEILIRDEETMNYEVHNRYGMVKTVGKSYFKARWWAFLNADKVVQGWSVKDVQIEIDGK
jgi:hypothetical protein